MSPIDVFIAYAEPDKPLMERLRKQLSAAERIGLVDAWHDGEIEIGSNREEASHKAMEDAEIVVLLLSADFFASEYLYENEMAQALSLSAAGKASVIPVLLKECTWQLTPVSKLQMLPKNAIPVTSEHWKHPDRAFKQVVDEIIRASNQIRKDQGIATAPYTPTKEKEEPVLEKTIHKTIPQQEVEDQDKTSLIKLALYAFGGLAAIALLSFLVNKVFTNPPPKEPVGQEQPRTPVEPSKGQQKPPLKEEPQAIPPSFATIKLGNLEWAAKNMNIVRDDSWCYQDNPESCSTYGRLYNFKAARKLCPEGWRLPSKEEWLSLSTDDISRLGLTKGGVYDRGGYRQSNQIGYYFTPENTGGDLAWVIEFRGNDRPLQKDRRYAHWGMSCRCVR